MQFNPNDFAQKNGNFVGLPYDLTSAQVVLLPVPWEATVSYQTGTALGPAAILEASYQLDLHDWDIPKAWETPIHWKPEDATIVGLNQKVRPLAAAHIDALENGQLVDQARLSSVNEACQQVNNWVYQQTKTLLQTGKKIGLIGGDHSVPLGYLRALAEIHNDFGILQIDAHCDLRANYESFTYSHASIFFNALESIPAICQLTQIGIRDTCQEELAYVSRHKERIRLFSMPSIRQTLFNGRSNFHQICLEIIDSLPHKVYLSFDIDGLDPALCPNTGTPVPGGFSYQEAVYLIGLIRKSGRQLIGFDLCEVSGKSEWDANVGARVCYKLAVELGACSP
jgi:agmatinase